MLAKYETLKMIFESFKNDLVEESVKNFSKKMKDIDKEWFLKIMWPSIIERAKSKDLVFKNIISCAS